MALFSALRPLGPSLATAYPGIRTAWPLLITFWALYLVLLVRSLWAHFEARDWDAARTLLHADFTCHWPHTRERIVGRDNFIALNENYPGDWHITIVRVIADGRQVATEVIVDLDGQQEPAVSFFEVVQGKIVQLTEYWPQPYAPPSDDSVLGRAQWVERY